MSRVSRPQTFGALLLAAFVLYLAADVYSLNSLEGLALRLQAVQDVRAAHPVASAALLFGLFVAMAALSIPGTLLLTIAAGALFGLPGGTVLISFAYSLGATLSFLASRWLFRASVQERFGTHLAAVNQGIAEGGGYYLFSLRLMPLVPFVLLNPLMGLTPIRTWTFYWITQVSGLLGTLLYVNAGTRLANLSSVDAVVSPAVLLSLAALGLLPLTLRCLVKRFQSARGARHDPGGTARAPETAVGDRSGGTERD